MDTGDLPAIYARRPEMETSTATCMRWLPIEEPIEERRRRAPAPAGIWKAQRPCLCAAHFIRMFGTPFIKILTLTKLQFYAFIVCMSLFFCPSKVLLVASNVAMPVSCQARARLATKILSENIFVTRNESTLKFFFKNFRAAGPG